MLTTEEIRTGSPPFQKWRVCKEERTYVLHYAFKAKILQFKLVNEINIPMFKAHQLKIIHPRQKIIN